MRKVLSNHRSQYFSMDTESRSHSDTPSRDKNLQPTPEIERLTKLLEHWAEHNEEHRKRFEESADNAEKMGLEDVADSLRSAALNASEVTEQLRKALEALD